ncbi:putative PIF1 DNA helicase/replication protein A1-like protein [Senna tora]|uniref:Putative PIF1 DNA helicase/replication protein A1-like protein n=1 Tax=Senna tora TaxID=362788 RepID=A0A834XH21_9FABA|nr:putative PIF1 DNA helicase/replication protein A1-like protein [Senna tora]
MVKSNSFIASSSQSMEIDARKQRMCILTERRMSKSKTMLQDVSCNANSSSRVYEIQNSLAIINFHHVNVKKTTSPPAKLTQEYVDISLPTHECEHCGALFWYEERVNKLRQIRKPKFLMCCLQGKVKLPKRQNPLEILERLLVNNDARSKDFKRLHCQNMHLMGGLLPKDDESPRFSQLYIYDLNNKVSNRIRNARSVKDHRAISNREELRLKLIKKRNTDDRVYNLPTADEIAALIVGDFDP